MTQPTVLLLRFKVLAAAIAVAMLILVGRLWQLQLFKWQDYAEAAASTRLKEVWEPAPRGTIYDRNGTVLADNRAVWNINIRPADFPSDEGEAEKVIQQLASILPSKPTTVEVREAVANVKASRANVESAPLAKIGEDIPLEVVAQIEEHSYELPGIEVVEVSRRFYPLGERACHVLGYARGINAGEYDSFKDIPVPAAAAGPTIPGHERIQESLYTPNSIIGKSGIEKSCELDTSEDPPVPMLQGIRGRTRYEVTITGEPAGPPVDRRAPQPGAAVYLTLDTHLQAVAERSLKHATKAGPVSVGAAVLLDVNSGEVLVLASVPGYDPNKWVRGWSAKELERLQSDPHKPQFNYAIAGLFPPASTFKMISATAALCERKIKTNTTFLCEGKIRVGHEHQPFKCWKAHGRMDFYQGIAQSCDIYFYSLARKAGVTSTMLAEYADRFGLGKRTGIELSGEADGFVPTPEWKKNIKRDEWWEGDTLNMIIGQGDLTVTPLQMAVATAAVANGGKLVHPTLIRKIRWPDYTGRGLELRQPQAPQDLDIDPEALAKVRRGMRLACTSRHGTARLQFHDFPIRVAGKTGSAQHRLDRPTHAWFVAFAPYENPRYACAVVISEAGHGSKWAAPVARAILAAAFGLEAPAWRTTEGVGD